jgi:S1-C subfamily serine protease
MSRSGSSEGVGFAVSVQQAVSSADQLIAQGFVRYPLLGITGTDVSAQVAERFGLDNRRGAVVDSVAQGSGADVGGMRTGDLIVTVDGAPLRSMADLVAEVRRRMPGETVVFDVLRGDEQLRIEVVLGERPRS